MRLENTWLNHIFHQRSRSSSTYLHLGWKFSASSSSYAFDEVLVLPINNWLGLIGTKSSSVWSLLPNCWLRGQKCLHLCINLAQTLCHSTIVRIHATIVNRNFAYPQLYHLLRNHQHSYHETTYRAHPAGLSPNAIFINLKVVQSRETSPNLQTILL